MAWVDHLAGDTNAAAVRALDLYRDLLRFHQNDPAPRLAFAAADLERLTWGWNTAFGEDKYARYKAALERFTREYADFDISAFAVEREARVIQQEGDWVAAHDLANRAAKVFPNEPGGKLCHNLVLEIEAKVGGHHDGARLERAVAENHGSLPECGRPLFSRHSDRLGNVPASDSEPEFLFTPEYE